MIFDLQISLTIHMQSKCILILTNFSYGTNFIYAKRLRFLNIEKLWP